METCTWKYDKTDEKIDYWETECGEFINFDFGETPKSNGIIFCQFCGKRVRQEKRTFCSWKEDSEGLYWDTDCGQSFSLAEGTPEENKMKFCCFCGKKIAEYPYEGEED